MACRSAEIRARVRGRATGSRAGTGRERRIHKGAGIAQGEFEGQGGQVVWEADKRGLFVREHRRDRRFEWSSVTKAGLMELQSGVTPGVLPLFRLPGFRRLVRHTLQRSLEWRQLLIATGTRPSSIQRLAVPVGDLGADDLVETIRGAVGDRWVGEISMQEQYATLGIETPWFYTPLILGGAIVAAFLVLLVGGLAYLGVETMAGRVPEVVWVAALPVLLGGNWLWRRVRRR